MGEGLKILGKKQEKQKKKTKKLEWLNRKKARETEMQCFDNIDNLTERNNKQVILYQNII